MNRMRRYQSMCKFNYFYTGIAAASESARSHSGGVASEDPAGAACGGHHETVSGFEIYRSWGIEFEPLAMSFNAGEKLCTKEVKHD